MRRRVPRLPDAYQEVNYIESTWTQYIDSWYTPNYNTEISCKFAHNENVIDTPVFWARTSGGGNQYVLWSHPIGYSAQWACQFNNTQSASFTSLSVGTEIEFSYDKTWWNYWSQSWTWSPASWTPNVNIIIFWLRQWTSIDNRKFAGKMWYFQISENWILKKNFVPCYRKSDSVIWMYDLVNDQFYTNAWSGTFTKGTDSSTLELKEFQVWPDEWWELFDETIIANSTTWSSWVIASVNGTFIRPSYTFGGWNGAYTKTTREWYDVISASWSHWNCHIWMSQSTYDALISNYSKIKIVVDYFNIWSKPSSYTNGVYFGNRDYINATSSGVWIGADWAGANLALSTWYSLEEIINTSDLSTTATITKISDGTKQVLWPFTKSFFKETSSTYIINGWWPCWARVVRDNYWWPVDVGNIHIYVC